MNKYKSWSGLKKQLSSFLCDSLKDKISYFYTTYHEVHNAYGRATISYNKKELVAFSWVEMYEQEYDMYDNPKEELKDKWMMECTLCEKDFLKSVTTYLNTDVQTALTSDDYLLKVFAFMDKRVGKRTLVKIKNEVEKLPEWVKEFYNIRCKEENI